MKAKEPNGKKYSVTTEVSVLIFSIEVLHQRLSYISKISDNKYPSNTMYFQWGSMNHFVYHAYLTHIRHSMFYCVKTSCLETLPTLGKPK